MSNNNEPKQLEAMQEQLKMFGDTVAKLQQECHWLRKKITQLESQLAGYPRGIDKHSGVGGKCDGMGYLRARAQREKCNLRKDAACTSCGECGKKTSKLHP